jgi:ABC-2 type transport system ATP-binding protein
MNAIEIENVSKRFGEFQALKNLSLVIPQGSMYGLVGPNGAGKTTLIRMMMNITLPDEGSLKVFGASVDEHVKERIGYLPEERGLYPKMKVGEVLLFLAELKGMARSRAKAAIDHWLETFDLASWKNKKVDTLSKGMQQKVQFIATVLHQPELIILDEPFSGMDPLNTKLLKDIMTGLHGDGRTILFSTHILEQVEMICEDLCLIDKGSVVLQGNVAEVKKSFGKNIVVLQCEGDREFVAHLPEVARLEDQGKCIRIHVKEGFDPHGLLQKVVGRLIVNRFEVSEPSLNDIFLEVVGQNNEKNSSCH